MRNKIMKFKEFSEELENIDEGKFANIAAGVGLAASSLFGGKDAIAQDKFKDKIENLGDKISQLKADAGEKIAQLKTDAGEKIAQLKTDAGETLAQLKDDLRQAAPNIKDKTELKNIGSRNYSFDDIKKEFEEESKKDDVQYGIGQSKDQGFSWHAAFDDAAERYMKKSPNKLKKVQVQIKNHKFQKQDGTYVTIALFRFESR